MRCGKTAGLAYVAGLHVPQREDKMDTGLVKLMLKLADCRVSSCFSEFLKFSGQKPATNG